MTLAMDGHRSTRIRKDSSLASSVLIGLHPWLTLLRLMTPGNGPTCLASLGEFWRWDRVRFGGGFFRELL
jgi:hypothetical protein